MHSTRILLPQDVHSTYHALAVHNSPLAAATRRNRPQQPDLLQPANTQMPAPQQASQSTPSTSRQEKEPVHVVGIPAMTPDGIVLVADAQSSSTRSYTLLRVVGDGSFGTVWLCDWHSPLPPNTTLSPMQRGAGARPEWAGKRLVAVKRMKKRWDGGWEECRKLKELESLRLISRHPNIIPLYDYFLLPSTKELYFVFECMEGNLYQLIKARKSRPLAGGLVSSIFSQVVMGLHHIHQSGYFHRDMKPENLLVTTTGLQSYQTTNPLAAPNAPPERDVVVIVKLADFGLARETVSNPPYTEYVSTRWYRAPEVLLRSRDYSNPVDMWALGTIMAELINLKPLFPGSGEIDQVARICEVLGDPTDEYGFDERGASIGGGKWHRGIEMARLVGFAFPKQRPMSFRGLFQPTVPASLIECISDLLKYDPSARLTSYDCLHHRYLTETAPRPPATSSHHPSPPQQQPHHVMANGHHPRQQPIPAPRNNHSIPAISPRHAQPSHSFPSPLHVTRPAFQDGASPTSSTSLSSPSPLSPYGEQFQLPKTGTTSNLADQLRELDLPTDSLSAYGYRQGARPSDADATSYPQPAINRTEQWAPERPSQYNPQGDSYISNDDMRNGYGRVVEAPPIEVPKGNEGHGRSGLFGFGKKSKPWTLFGGGDHKSLPPADEVTLPSTGSTPSLKRTQSGSTSDSRSLSEFGQPCPQPQRPPPVIVTAPTDAKQAKKDADRAAKEAIQARRAEQEEAAKARSRAVLQKRAAIETPGSEIEWTSSVPHRRIPPGPDNLPLDKGKERMHPLPRRGLSLGVGPGKGAGAREPLESFNRSMHPIIPEDAETGEDDYHAMLQNPRSSKARRRDRDDDHSMSSADRRSDRRLSINTLATVDSDPGPARPRQLRERGSTNFVHRAPSYSSLRSGLSTGGSSNRGFSPGARSSTSLEQGFLTEFASLNGPGGVSPLNHHSHQHPLPHQQHPHHPSRPPESSPDSLHPNSLPPLQNGGLQTSPYTITLPPISSISSPPFPSSNLPSTSPSNMTTHSSRETLHPNQEYAFTLDGPPGSPMNPMFLVPTPMATAESIKQGYPRPSLPPFSHIASVADHGDDRMSDPP